MRHVQIIIFLLVSVFSFASAQNGIAALPDTATQTGTTDEEVSVASLVEKQIAMAQAKQWENRQTEVKQKPVAAAPIKNKTKENWFTTVSTPFKLSGDTAKSVGIILFSTLLVFGSVITRRLVLKHKNKPTNLRTNIQSMRLEKSVVKKETKLKSIRENLLKSSLNFNSGEGSLTRKAKELKIAKGEIMLAAKIKSYELSVCSSDR